jgi:hypothetical protein
MSISGSVKASKRFKFLPKSNESKKLVKQSKKSKSKSKRSRKSKRNRNQGTINQRKITRDSWLGKLSVEINLNRLI